MPQLHKKTKPIISKSPEQTKEIGEKIAKNLIKKSRDKDMKAVICLHGALGAGKTTFAKGFARGLGIEERKIKSPSFTYIREHRKNSTKLYHCDFYRLEGKNEWIQRAFEELHNDTEKDAIFIIEWSEKLGEKLPEKRIDIFLETISMTERKIKITDYVDD